MFKIKNYYQQLSELRIAETRLATLEEKKNMIKTKITKVTSTPKDIVTFGGVQSDKMTEYVIKVEEIDKEIDEVKEELEITKKGLDKMNEILKHVSGIEEKIFRLYYIENKTPIQISFIVPCSRATVYRYIKEIKQKFKNEKK